jgi:hypothetical protein
MSNTMMVFLYVSILYQSIFKAYRKRAPQEENARLLSCIRILCPDPRLAGSFLFEHPSRNAVIRTFPSISSTFL